VHRFERVCGVDQFASARRTDLAQYGGRMMKWQAWRPVQGLVALTAFAVLTGVFLLYQRPEFVVNLSDLFWGCF
jgi:hypothetical protein